MPRTRRFSMLGAAAATVALLAIVAAGCVPPAPPAPTPYLDQLYSATVTPKVQAITWGAATPIDAAYGGALYAGTAIEQQRPAPAARRER